MKRILMVTGIYPPDIGGPAKYVPAVAKELRARGHVVKIITLSDFTLRQDGDGDDVIRIKRRQFLPKRYLQCVVEILKHSRFSDFVYVNGLNNEAQFAARLSGKKTIHKIVGDRSWERLNSKGIYKGTIDEYQETPKTALMRVLDFLRNYSLRGASRIIVPSQYLKKIVMKWGVPEERISVIYNSVDLRSSSITEAIRDIDIITVCRLVPWKGVDKIIEMVCSLRNVKLHIVGDGPLRGALEQQVLMRSAGDKVIFHGHLENSKVQMLLKKSKIFILFSTYEGLPHVVLEAMHCGAVVIATRVGGTPEAVIDGKTGILINQEVESLKLAVTRILEDEELRLQMVAEANTFLEERFGFEHMVEELEQCFDTILLKADINPS